MTQFEKVICTCYTGVRMIFGEDDYNAYKDFLNYIEMDDLDGLQWKDKNYVEKLKNRVKPLFLSICNNTNKFTRINEYIYE